MKELSIGHNFKLPLEAVTQTFGILAKRGVGKTYCGAVMVEEMLAAQQQTVVADPVGVWWGLRSGDDGTAAGGYPVVVFGGEHADVPLEETGGEIIARAIVEHGFSAVLDLSLLRKNAQDRFMTAFAETLYQLNRRPLHFCVDEADAFCPQRPQRGQERLLGAFEDIVRRGRARGLGVTLITQRAAVINKNVLTQIEVLVCLRTISPQDREAVDAWIEVHGTQKQRDQMLSELPSLPIGTAYFWSPGWLDIFEKVKIRKRRTFDSSATPKVGEQRVVPKSTAAVDLTALGEQIKATVEKAKANDPPELKRALAVEKKRVNELETKLANAHENTAKLEPKWEIKEMPMFTVKERTALTKILDDMVKLNTGLETIRTSLDYHVQKWIEVNGRLEFVRAVLAEKTGARIRVMEPKGGIVGRPDTTLPPRRPETRPIAVSGTPEDQNGSLGKCERTLLSVLAKYPEGCRRQKLILLAGYCWSGSTQNALGKLRSLGYISGGNADLMQITEAGMSHGDTQPLPAGEALRDYWLNFPHFGKCEREMLRCLFNHPQGLAREALLEGTGYEWSGSTQNALGALRTAGVIVGRNNEVMRVAPEILEAL